MKSYSFGIVFFLLVMTAAFLSSCHSRYVHLSLDLHHGACWNDQHSRVACIISTAAYRPARGLARFPDGGIPEYLLEEVALYVFEPGSSQISELYGFDDLAVFLGHSRSNWKTRIAFTDSLVFCSVSPVMEWEWYLEHTARTATDSQQVYQLKEKYDRPFTIDETSGAVSPVSTSRFDAVYHKEKAVDFMTLHGQLTALPLAEFGLVIGEIYPKPAKAYIEETIYLKNESTLSRRAVVEQIISGLTKDEIRDLLEEMDRYKEDLKEEEKEIIEERFRKVYDRMQALL